MKRFGPKVIKLNYQGGVFIAEGYLNSEMELGSTFDSSKLNWEEFDL